MGGGDGRPRAPPLCRSPTWPGSRADWWLLPCPSQRGRCRRSRAQPGALRRHHASRHATCCASRPGTLCRRVARCSASRDCRRVARRHASCCASRLGTLCHRVASCSASRGCRRDARRSACTSCRRGASCSEWRGAILRLSRTLPSAGRQARCLTPRVPSADAASPAQWHPRVRPQRLGRHIILPVWWREGCVE